MPKTQSQLVINRNLNILDLSTLDILRGNLRTHSGLPPCVFSAEKDLEPDKLRLTAY